MKKSSILILSLIASVVFIGFGCSSQKNSPVFKEIIKNENLTEIVKKVKDDKVISKEDIDLFANGLARLSLMKDSVVLKTVGQVIESQKEFQKRVSLQGLDRSAVRAEMAFSHSFKFLNMKFFDTDTAKSNILFFRFSNLSDQDIENIQGYINIFNPQNQIVKKFPVNMKRVIPANEGLDIQTPPYKHDDKNPNDMLVRTGKNLRVVWQPVTVEFKNGKKLLLPQ